MTALAPTRVDRTLRLADGSRLVVTVQVTEERDRLRASFMGEVIEPRKRIGFAFGQVSEYAPEPLRTLWDRWHLNDMKAGCEHQEARYREHPDERPTWMNKYAGSTGDTLKSECPECGYPYGAAWMYEPLPDDFLDLLAVALDASAKAVA